MVCEPKEPSGDRSQHPSQDRGYPVLRTCQQFEAPVAMTVGQVHVDDTHAPCAAVVMPWVFVAARDELSRLLLVRRRDSGLWELPGGRVDVGENSVAAAIRQTVEESGVRVRVVGIVGRSTNPAHVVGSVSGEVRQQFVVCFRATPVQGEPCPDLVETVDAAWFDPARIVALAVEPAAQRWIGHALLHAPEPHLG